MGSAGYNIREVRIVIEDELTHCYVLLEALGDCPIGVHGWHHKVFPSSVPGMQAYEQAVREGVMWGQEAPPR